MLHAEGALWLKFSFSSGSGMGVYIVYAGVQVSALGGTTPTYDIYDSDNYPLVFRSPASIPALAI